MTEYGPHDLIHELQIFRDVLFSVAETNHLVLSRRDVQVIERSIEEAARDSITGYNAVNKEVSEAFIASLSHDLRNPLHVASASAQLLLLKTSDPALTNLAKRIVRKIAETDAMIQTLLDAAVLRSQMKLRLRIARFNIMLLIEEVCADLPLLGQQVRVEGMQIEGCWCRTSIRRVLENLISNAQKYGDSSKAITVSVNQVDSRIFIAVHNEGLPIPEIDMERLFNAFQRIEEIDVKGWGLGLPYVQNVAESHGGSVIVDSGEGRGTTFTVSLPIDARPYVK
jgi:signal transduction histidine kinase